MKLSDVLKPLIDAKADHDTILRVVLAYEQSEAGDVEASREKARERWRRWKAKHPETNVGKRLQTATNNSHGGVTPVEDKPQTIDTNTPKKESTPRAALEAVLDAERADAVIQHRQRLRKPLTGHAAKLLAVKLAECPDPNAAADTMIGKGWLSVEPEWLTKQSARGSPPAKPRGIGGVFSDLVEHLENGTDDEDRGRQDAGPTVLSLSYRRTG